MMQPSVSVVVVSHNRPDHLTLCLKALTFQTRRNFEIIVVHDTGSLCGLLASGIADEVKTALFEPKNISAARNIGIDLAAGKIVAFIDDDAIAEPGWLERLIAPFDDPEIRSAGGFVVGPSGFGLQWKGEVLDDDGTTTEIGATETKIIYPKPGSYAKTHGTNCAFRRSELIAQGGFDENFHYFLDESDLNIRIGTAGGAVAIVPSAQVHHAFAPSHTRTNFRAPKSLFDIGASSAYFLKKHDRSMDRLSIIRSTQLLRLKKFVVSGHLEPRDVKPLLATLDAGFREGAKREPIPRTLNSETGNFRDFRPYHAPTRVEFLSCRRLASKAARIQAAETAATGSVTTLLELSWTNWRHRRGFHADGYWFQKGGIFGKSDRRQASFQLETFATRSRKEIENLRQMRGLSD